MNNKLYDDLLRVLQRINSSNSLNENRMLGQTAQMIGVQIAHDDMWTGFPSWFESTKEEMIPRVREKLQRLYDDVSPEKNGR